MLPAAMPLLNLHSRSGSKISSLESGTQGIVPCQVLTVKSDIEPTELCCAYPILPVAFHYSPEETHLAHGQDWHQELDRRVLPGEGELHRQREGLERHAPTGSSYFQRGSERG